MRRIAILLTALTLSACGDSTAPTTELKWGIVPGPTTTDQFLSIWGSSPTDVWVAGRFGPSNDQGEVFHYDGSSWSTALHGAVFNSVWGTSASDVWAVGCCTTFIWHFNGTAWSDVSFNPNAVLRAVWGTSPSNVWAVGNGGTIVHYDGAQWSSVASGTTEDLMSVWGTSSSDVWAAGFATILHYDGSNWLVSYNPDNPLDQALISTGWSSSPTDAWALGSAGVPGKAFHYNGSAWTPASAPTVATFGVWGTARNDVWAVGTPACCTNCFITPCSGNGTFQDVDDGVRHWDGNTWMSVHVGSSQVRNAIWGSSSSDIWIVGDGSIVRGVRH